MKPHPQRKAMRFFVINPEKDRRFESRFSSKEEVVVRVENTGQTIPGTAYDIGQKGLKLETHKNIDPLSNIQVVFPKSGDHVRCFGRAIWSRPLAQSRTFETGISVQSWLGIVGGSDAWKKYKGFKPKRDRRHKSR